MWLTAKQLEGIKRITIHYEYMTNDMIEDAAWATFVLKDIRKNTEDEFGGAVAYCSYGETFDERRSDCKKVGDVDICEDEEEEETEESYKHFAAYLINIYMEENWQEMLYFMNNPKAKPMEVWIELTDKTYKYVWDDHSALTYSDIVDWM